MEVPSYSAAHYNNDKIPSVVLHKKVDGISKALLMIRFKKLADGCHIFFHAEPEEKSTPVLHIVMKTRNMRKATSAIVAGIALCAVNPKFPTKGKPRDNWFRKMYERLDKLAEEKGAEAFLGVPPCIVEATRLCKISFEKAMGLDAEDAVQEVRKAFSVLVNHLEEEDIIRMWKEAHVKTIMEA